MQIVERFHDIYLSEMVEYLCPYYNDGRIATVELIYPVEKQRSQYHRFLRLGFCRSYECFFQNLCQGCDACQPLRVEVERFALDHSQRRVLRANADLQLTVERSNELNDEKLDLFARYKMGRHPDSEPPRVTVAGDSGGDGGTGAPCDSDNGVGMQHSAEDPARRAPAVNPAAEEMDHAAEAKNVHYGFPYTFQILYRLEGKLIGVSIIDEGEDSLSSHCFYYDPEVSHARRLGVFSAITEIAYARILGKQYYYLGFYIRDISNMAYKKHFKPNELYINGEWAPFR